MQLFMPFARLDALGSDMLWAASTLNLPGGGPGLSKIRVSLQSTTFPGAAPGCPYRVLLFAGPAKREAWGLGYHPRPGSLAEAEIGGKFAQVGKAGGPGLRPTKQACHPTGLSCKGVLTEYYFFPGRGRGVLTEYYFLQAQFREAAPPPPVDSMCLLPRALVSLLFGEIALRSLQRDVRGSPRAGARFRRRRHATFCGEPGLSSHCHHRTRGLPGLQRSQVAPGKAVKKKAPTAPRGPPLHRVRHGRRQRARPPSGLPRNPPAPTAPRGPRPYRGRRGRRPPPCGRPRSRPAPPARRGPRPRRAKGGDRWENWCRRRRGNFWGVGLGPAPRPRPRWAARWRPAPSGATSRRRRWAAAWAAARRWSAATWRPVRWGATWRRRRWGVGWEAGGAEPVVGGHVAPGAVGGHVAPSALGGCVEGRWGAEPVVGGHVAPGAVGGHVAPAALGGWVGCSSAAVGGQVAPGAVGGHVASPPVGAPVGSWSTEMSAPWLVEPASSGGQVAPSTVGSQVAPAAVGGRVVATGELGGHVAPSTVGTAVVEGGALPAALSDGVGSVVAPSCVSDCGKLFCRLRSQHFPAFLRRSIDLIQAILGIRSAPPPPATQHPGTTKTTGFAHRGLPEHYKSLRISPKVYVAD
eukprot:gene4890-biopygen13082